MLRRSGWLLLLFLTLNTQAQTDSVFYGRDTNSTLKPKRPQNKSQDFVKRLTFGGNFQAWFGTVSFVFLSPTVGYRVNDNVNIGLGLIYNYSSVNYGPPYGKVSQSIYGFDTYARYIIAQTYFVQAQFDKLYQPDWFSRIPNDKTWVNYLMVGGGFRQPVGPKGAIMTSIMYNLTPSPLSIYPGRVIIQFGFVSGF